MHLHKWKTRRVFGKTRRARLFYAIFCVIDVFTNMYTLHVFITSPTFTMAGYLTAMFQAANLLGILFVGFVGKKFDFKNLNFVFGLICVILYQIVL